MITGALFCCAFNGTEYYLAGPADGPGGATDIPGHYWIRSGGNRIVGKHFNTGPFEAPQWWSSDAPDGELLYKVNGIIDIWSEEKAADYADQGYIHYHELVSVENRVDYVLLTGIIVSSNLISYNRRLLCDPSVGESLYTIDC